MKILNISFEWVTFIPSNVLMFLTFSHIFDYCFILHFRAFLFSSYILLLPYFFFEFVFFGSWHCCLTTRVVKIFARCSLESPTLISFNVFVLLWRLLSFSDSLFFMSYVPLVHNSLKLFVALCLHMT